MYFLSTVLVKACKLYYKFSRIYFLCISYFTLIGHFHMESFLCYEGYIHILFKLHKVTITLVSLCTVM